MIDFRLASASQIQVEIGERLRRERAAKSWTQRDLALRAGVALNAVKNLEAGGNVTVASLIKVMQVLSLISELGQVFQAAAIPSIADLERLEAPQRQRVRVPKR